MMQLEKREANIAGTTVHFATDFPNFIKSKPPFRKPINRSTLHITSQFKKSTYCGLLIHETSASRMIELYIPVARVI